MKNSNDLKKSLKQPKSNSWTMTKYTETCHVPLQNLLWTNETSITPTFPKVFFLMVLKHVMDSIIMFTFGNTFELQLFRTAREYVLLSKN